MPAHRSLRSSKEYRRVMSGGRRARRDGVTVVAAASGAGEGPRVGVIARVGRGRAVARNRARRRLREAVLVARPAPGFDIVVGADADTLEMEFQELVMSVTDALTDAGVECGR